MPGSSKTWTLCAVSESLINEDVPHLLVDLKTEIPLLQQLEENLKIVKTDESKLTDNDRIQQIIDAIKKYDSFVYIFDNIDRLNEDEEDILCSILEQTLNIATFIASTRSYLSYRNIPFSYIRSLVTFDLNEFGLKPPDSDLKPGVHESRLLRLPLLHGVLPDLEHLGHMVTHILSDIPEKDRTIAYLLCMLPENPWDSFHVIQNTLEMQGTFKIRLVIEELMRQGIIYTDPTLIKRSALQEILMHLVDRYVKEINPSLYTTFHQNAATFRNVDNILFTLDQVKKNPDRYDVEYQEKRYTEYFIWWMYHSIKLGNDDEINRNLDRLFAIIEEDVGSRICLVLYDYTTSFLSDLLDESDAGRTIKERIVEYIEGIISASQ